MNNNINIFDLTQYQPTQDSFVPEYNELSKIFEGYATLAGEHKKHWITLSDYYFYFNQLEDFRMESILRGEN